MEGGFGSKNDKFVKVVLFSIIFFDSRRILICCYDFEHDVDYMNRQSTLLSVMMIIVAIISLFYAAFPTIFF